MAEKRLLLLSNSKNYGQNYLQHAEHAIKAFLTEKIKKALFIPFAAVRTSLDDFSSVVRGRFRDMGYELESIHHATNGIEAVKNAEAIVVGGGNTFHLLHCLYQHELLEAIRSAINGGVPYLGWSAGANIVCPTIKTTNDMPIIEPTSFNALGLLPFQINLHYTDEHLTGHQGETRAERIAEFVELNPDVYVVGLREGSMLRIEGNALTLLGDRDVKIFLKGQDPIDYSPKDSLQFLLP